MLAIRGTPHEFNPIAFYVGCFVAMFWKVHSDSIYTALVVMAIVCWRRVHFIGVCYRVLDNIAGKLHSLLAFFLRGALYV